MEINSHSLRINPCIKRLTTEQVRMKKSHLVIREHWVCTFGTFSCTANQISVNCPLQAENCYLSREPIITLDTFEQDSNYLMPCYVRLASEWLHTPSAVKLAQHHSHPKVLIFALKIHTNARSFVQSLRMVFICDAVAHPNLQPAVKSQ